MQFGIRMVQHNQWIGTVNITQLFRGGLRSAVQKFSMTRTTTMVSQQLSFATKSATVLGACSCPSVMDSVSIRSRGYIVIVTGPIFSVAFLHMHHNYKP